MIALSYEKDICKWMVIIVYMGKERKKNLEIISKWIEEERPDKIIIGGDFSARIGEGGGVIIKEGEREKRK